MARSASSSDRPTTVSCAAHDCQVASCSGSSHSFASLGVVATSPFAMAERGVHAAARLFAVGNFEGESGRTAGAWPQHMLHRIFISAIARCVIQTAAVVQSEMSERKKQKVAGDTKSGAPSRGGKPLKVQDAEVTEIWAHG